MEPQYCSSRSGRLRTKVTAIRSPVESWADVGIVGHDHAHLGAELCFGPHGSKKRDVAVELIIERVLGIDWRGRQALAGLERVASRDVAAAAMDSLLIGNDCVS
jgi:hypothetical protein